MLFHFVLGLRRRRRLPLHVRWGVDAAALERDYVVDHVAVAAAGGLTGRRTRMRLLKIVSGSGAALDSAVAVASAADAPGSHGGAAGTRHPGWLRGSGSRPANTGRGSAGGACLVGGGAGMAGTGADDGSTGGTAGTGADGAAFCRSGGYHQSEKKGKDQRRANHSI